MVCSEKNNTVVLCYTHFKYLETNVTKLDNQIET